MQQILMKIVWHQLLNHESYRLMHRLLMYQCDMNSWIRCRWCDATDTDVHVVRVISPPESDVHNVMHQLLMYQYDMSSWNRCRWCDATDTDDDNVTSALDSDAYRVMHHLLMYQCDISYWIRCRQQSTSAPIVVWCVSGNAASAQCNYDRNYQLKDVEFMNTENMSVYCSWKINHTKLICQNICKMRSPWQFNSVSIWH